MRLLAKALVVVSAFACACASEGPAPDSASQAPGGPGRRVFEGCIATEAVASWRDVVGERVLIAWSWNDPDSPSARLRAPAVVLRVEEASVAVDFDARMPNRSVYVAAWTYSGHIASNPDGSFAVDPCSASFEPDGW